MRTLIDTLHRLLGLPSVEGVAFFAPNGASYCARLDTQVGALERTAPAVSAWFREVGSEVRFLEMRASDQRLLWFRAGSGVLFVAANSKAHVASLASRIALSIVALVDAVAPEPQLLSRVTRSDEPSEPLGTPTIPAPHGESSRAVTIQPLNPVVTIVGATADKPGALATDPALANSLLLGALNALSQRAASALGGPVRRNYFNRARKLVAAGGPLDAFEIELDGRLRCATLAELPTAQLAPEVARWCQKFIELVAVIEPDFAATDLNSLVVDDSGVLSRIGFLRTAPARGEAAQ